MNAHVEIWRDDDGQYRWRHRAAGNNEIDAQGEAYRNREDCMETVIRLFPTTRIDILEGEE